MQTIWILGDQLQEANGALALADRKKDRVLLIESRKRSGHLKYHQQKLVLIYAAMRHRAAELRATGYHVDYHEMADDFTVALRAHVTKHKPAKIVVEEPNDFATTQALPALARQISVPIETVPSTMFLVPRAEFRAWAGESASLLMEHHYRRMRKKHKILLDAEGQPEGGEWNYDAENREPYRAFAKAKARPPAPARVAPDTITKKVIALVEQHFADHPGSAAGFWLPVTRAGARAWLEQFINERLATFGPFEDVMATGEPVLSHSVLSPLLNIGLVTARECVEAAETAFRQGRAPLASVEGFVRQIIGWREFINGVYWLRMPEYTKLNALEAKRPLPAWIYSGETEMNCVSISIKQALALGWNHHIQRLMVLGNFFLLGGFDPQAVLRWYLEMYVDAYDWVMAANVLGMILFADGGYMATKPYAAGAGYIHKMSNYCEGCRYRPDVRTGPDACPFNYLYWNFFATHQKRFAANHRVSMMIRTWEKKPDREQQQIREDAKAFLDGLGSPVESK